MALPVPNLDDRRFQDLVDDAKRLVQQTLPGVDRPQRVRPGRDADRDVRLDDRPAALPAQPRPGPELRQVPRADRRQPLPADRGAARTSRSGCRRRSPDVVRIPTGTEVATVRTETDEAIVFATIEDLPIVPLVARRARLDDRRQGLPRPLRRARERPAASSASTRPKPGDALLVGLSEAVPSYAVRLRFSCHIEGVGVDPNNPPLAWEAWTATTGSRASSTRTRPAASTATATSSSTSRAATSRRSSTKQRAGWIRARVIGAVEGQPAYSASPSITSLAAFTIGGTAEAVNAELVQDEDARHLRGRARPAVHAQARPRRPRRRAGRCSRSPATRAGRSGPRSRTSRARPRPTGTSCSTMSGGEIRLGPAVREADGIAPPVRRGAAEGRPAPDALVPHRRRPQGQRRRARR